MSEATAEPTTSQATPAPAATMHHHSGERSTSAFTPEVSFGEIMRQVKADADASEAAARGGSTSSTSKDAEPNSGTESKEPTEPAPEKTDHEDATPPTVDELVELAKSGNVDDLLRKLGVDPEGMKVPSQRFADWRRKTKETERRLAARENEQREKESQFQSTLSKALSEVEPLYKAREMFQSGDVLGALKSAFGTDYDKIIEDAISQQAGRDPELLRLKREDERRKQADREAEERARVTKAQQEHARREAAYVQQITEELGRSSDPILAKAAQDPSFMGAVYKAQLLEYDNGRGREITTEEAAAKVIETIRAAHLRWADVFGNSAGGSQSPANTDRAGITPSNTAPAGTSPAKGKPNGVPRSRVGATPPRRLEDMTTEELIAHFGREMDEASNA